MGPGGLAAVQGAVDLGVGALNTGIQYFAQRGLMREQDRLNSIGHKMDQYRDAGVNPMFAVGDGQAQGSVGLGQVAPPNIKGPDVAGIGLKHRELDYMRDQAQAALENAQANRQNAETAQYDAETRRMELETVKQPLRANQVRVGNSIVKLNEAEADKVYKLIDEIDARIDLMELQKIADSINILYSSDTYELRKAEIIAEIAKKQAEAFLASKEAEEAVQRAKESKSRTTKQDLENELQQAFNYYWTKTDERKTQYATVMALGGKDYKSLVWSYTLAGGANADEHIMTRQQEKWNEDHIHTPEPEPTAGTRGTNYPENGGSR